MNLDKKTNLIYRRWIHFCDERRYNQVKILMQVRFFYLYLYKYEYVKKILFIYFIHICYIDYNRLYHDRTFFYTYLLFILISQISCLNTIVTFLYFNYIFYISIIFFVLQSSFSVSKSHFFYAYITHILVP